MVVEAQGLRSFKVIFMAKTIHGSHGSNMSHFKPIHLAGKKQTKEENINKRNIEAVIYKPCITRQQPYFKDFTNYTTHELRKYNQTPEGCRWRVFFVCFPLVSVSHVAVS